jgi:Tol biopolymer transport system component
VPAELSGKIAFVSDRLGEDQVFVMDADGQNVALLTQRAVYDSARACEPHARDGLRRVIVQPGDRQAPQLFLVDARYESVTPITQLAGLAYDPAWAPRSERIAFVSTAPGNDEIYTVNPDGSDLQRLTWNTWEWDKHPTWSPGGRQIAFYSNRLTGRRQIWVMDADGADVRNLSNNEYNDWDPVWLK